MNISDGVSGALWLGSAINAGYVLLAASLVAALVRALRGASHLEGLLALMQAWLSAIGFIAIRALETREWQMLDLAFALALLGGIVSFAAAWLARRNASASTEKERADASADR